MRKADKYTTDLLGDRVSVQSLIQDLSSPDRFTRWAAVWGLQDVKDQEVFEHLVKALNDIHPNVRAAAATVLGWFRDERAVIPLLKRMKDNFDHVRLAAIEALGEIGDEVAAQPLRLFMENEETQTALWLAGLASLLMINEKKKG